MDIFSFSLIVYFFYLEFFYMACRFALYQNSVRKFITKNSVISSQPNKDELIKLIERSEFILPISLLTIMNGQHKKNKLKNVHGYDMASGIELLYSLMQYLEKTKLTKDPIRCAYDLLYYNLSTLAYLALSRNAENLLQEHLKLEFVKSLTLCSEQLTDKMNKITCSIINLSFPEKTKKHSKTDLFKYHFKHQDSFNTISKINIPPKDFILGYIDDTYGTICKLVLVLGWLMGGSSPDMIVNLERLGCHFGVFMKIAYDFDNIDYDIEHLSDTGFTLNYILNYGIQNAFELFDDCKTKFIEGLLTLEISTNTIKEFIDILEKKVIRMIDNSSPDIHLTSSPSCDTNKS